MNQRIIKLGLESGMLNYVEHETPRHYFLCANADEECLAKFAELIVRECGVALSPMLRDMVSRGQAFDLIKKHFGVEE
jgi:hypothetical protein